MAAGTARLLRNLLVLWSVLILQVSSTPLQGESAPAQEVRSRRQSQPDACAFGRVDDLTICGWQHFPNDTTQKWREGAGATCNWYGGPCIDATENDEQGGYILFEASQIPPVARSPADHNGMILSPLMEPTGPKGACLVFNYAIDGLSADRLRVLLRQIPEEPEELDGRQLGGEHPQDILLLETRDPTGGDWRTAEVVYTCSFPHQVVLEAVPKDAADPTRRYRGYLAVDNLDLRNLEGCPGHCPFDGGFCGWSNEAEGDDFDWKLGRGSRNPLTGPVVDRGSYTNGGVTGGYAYIDSSYPRRAGDKARLASIEFAPTGADSPLCMRFWTHMLGTGIGTLRVLLVDTNQRVDTVVWSLNGEAGNAWYQAQVPISSSKPFRIVYEAVIGRNELGDIAIDDISFSPGACPSAPQAASPRSGDCSFEVDECNWMNVLSSLRLDDLDWERRLGKGGRAPPTDHTLGSESGNVMTLATGSVQRAGDKAWLMSREFEGGEEARCLSFRYYMHEPFIDSTGPSLGGLKVYTKTIDENGMSKMRPIWRLYNQQGPSWKYAQAAIQEKDKFHIVFEGVIGSSRPTGYIAIDDITFFEGACTTLPESAFVHEGECFFEKDACGWRNVSKDPLFQWQVATISRRPANLPDNTFKAPVGYAYFDIFNQNADGNPVRLVSPSMKPQPDQSVLCATFWFSAFGAGESTQLRVLRLPDSNSSEGNGTDEQEGTLLWSLTAVNVDTVRPEWRPAQVAVDARSAFKLVLEGQATNGGFAVDDISFYPGSCSTRPEEASPESQ